MGEDRPTWRQELPQALARILKALNPKWSGEVRERAGILRGNIQQLPFYPFFGLRLCRSGRGTIEFIITEQGFE